MFELQFNNDVVAQYVNTSPTNLHGLIGDGRFKRIVTITKVIKHPAGLFLEYVRALDEYPLLEKGEYVAIL